MLLSAETTWPSAKTTLPSDEEAVYPRVKAAHTSTGEAAHRTSEKAVYTRVREAAPTSVDETAPTSVDEAAPTSINEAVPTSVDKDTHPSIKAAREGPVSTPRKCLLPMPKPRRFPVAVPAPLLQPTASGRVAVSPQLIVLLSFLVELLRLTPAPRQLQSPVLAPRGLQTNTHASQHPEALLPKALVLKPTALKGL